MTDGLRKPLNRWRAITWLLLAANFAFGIAIIASLPAFEGPDETAHFARVQSQAFIPQETVVATSSNKKDHPAAHISTEVFDYYRRGPMPSQWIDLTPLHVKDPLGNYITYKDFFAAPPKSIADYRRAYRETPLPPGFKPGPEPNWEYQHPGLYYLLMAVPFKHAAGHISLASMMFLLRSLSFAIAFAGFAIGLLATRLYLGRSGATNADKITALGAFYPFLMPQFFWEFARLGNDSLCLAFSGILWALTIWHLCRPRGDAWIYLGLFMGLSLMAKALMVPIAVSLLIFLFVYHRLAARNPGGSANGWWPPLKITLFAFAVGAPLYVADYLKSKDLGSINLRFALQSHNAGHMLLQHFTLSGFLTNILGMLQTAVWLFGSWSMIIIDPPVNRALLVSSVLVFTIYILAARRRRDILFFALPLWLIAVFFAGLTTNIFVALILQNKDPTPGYYIHILAPALALIYGVSLEYLMRRRWTKILTAIISAPILLFNFLILWSYMTAFSACTVPVRVKSGYLLHLADIARCAGSFDLVVSRLGILAWPGIALAAAGLALTLLAASALLTLRALRAAESL